MRQNSEGLVVDLPKKNELGKGRKFDFSHIFMVDWLGHDESYWMVFWQNILLFQRKMQNTKFR